MVGTRVCSILGYILGRVGCVLALPARMFTSSYTWQYMKRRHLFTHPGACYLASTDG